MWQLFCWSLLYFSLWYACIGLVRVWVNHLVIVLVCVDNHPLPLPVLEDQEHLPRPDQGHVLVDIVIAIAILRCVLVE